MKKYFLVFCSFSLLAFTFISCEQNADVDLPDVPSRLVINGFIAPQDTVISIRVTKSVPMFESSEVDVNEPVENATVRIFGNSTSVVLNYDASAGRYTIPASAFAIIPGNEYSIEVSAPQMETVTAKTTVPAVAPSGINTSMSYTIDSVSSFQWMYTIQSNLSFTDPVQEGNLYRISRNVLFYDAFSMDTVLLQLSDEVFPDNDQNGQTILNERNVDFSFSPPSSGGASPEAMNILLVSCSKDYYYFHLSLQNYSGGGDPFSEPTLMYTNVEKGYGVFAGCSYFAQRINF